MTIDYRRDCERYDDRVLPVWRLARIRDSLPERERWAFLLSLREDLCDQLIDYRMDRQDAEQLGGQL